MNDAQSFNFQFFDGPEVKVLVGEMPPSIVNMAEGIAETKGWTFRRASWYLLQKSFNMEYTNYRLISAGLLDGVNIYEKRIPATQEWRESVGRAYDYGGPWKLEVLNGERFTALIECRP